MSPRRHNIPAEPNQFVGRSRDLDELSRLVHETRLLTLSGIGGIGKTRCALQLATRVVEHFPDGVWLVELAKLTRPDLVLHEVVGTLGLREEGGRPLLDSLRDFLYGKRLLLVLDNCEHLVQPCAELAESLLAACPELRVVATSREPLKIPGELVWRVPPLAVPLPGQPIEQAESVELFLHRARAAGSGLALTADNAPDIERLCRDLDGLPLALELAAARTCVLSPGQIAQRIGDRFRLLTTASRTTPARQRTLQATIDWSHALLSPAEQVLFRRLSAFSGPFTLDLAELVCADGDLPAFQVLDRLALLVEKSLVLFDQGDACYRLLESTRQFAADRLEQAGESATMADRLLHGLAALATRHGHDMWLTDDRAWADRAAARDLLLRLADNARQAMTWAAASGQIAHGLRLACAYMPAWMITGSFAEGRGWLETFLERSEGEPAELVGDALVCHSALVFEQHDSAAAERSVARGLELCRAAGSPVLLGFALDISAMQAVFRGELAPARARAQEALEVIGPGGSGYLEAGARMILASVSGLEGHRREALAGGEGAIECYLQTGQLYGAARAGLELGRLGDALGELDFARRQLDRAISLAGEAGSQPLLALALGLLGLILARQDQGDDATDRIRECVRLSQSMGQHLPVASALMALAVLAEEQEDLEPAVRLWAAAKALEQRLGLFTFTSASPEPLLARARARLGDGLVSQWWAMGSAMSEEEAVRYGLEGVRPARVAKPAGGATTVLTAREREIVALIRRGMSNKAIAEELFISPATAARHVANILTKLNFSSRSQVAAWGAELHIGLHSPGHAGREPRS
ncbi:LuxR C-terminal-related transcriptional regulator [Nonomuraea soli]|uniref:Putative ATPase/DNA-binding CsgD family transcriptional regulator n=1 Tax=Nonomuraea soli TaxID=1032476 RepID=A0A7W0CN23_9ACTN|nr:LuxR C-terminal-related transcriptional regulator [Nonomuraea soli]MBA2894032.1 putative ATPase/DNA-binding CsgD family transcriptional regulator [Nonomuraea soli]